jgi:peptidyl-dipeptidase A
MCRTRATSSRAFCNSSFIAPCAAKRFSGPLYRCSFYGNKAAGGKLNKMLAMGASKPWPEALEALTGEENGRTVHLNTLRH